MPQSPDQYLAVFRDPEFAKLPIHERVKGYRDYFGPGDWDKMPEDEQLKAVAELDPTVSRAVKMSQMAQKFTDLAVNLPGPLQPQAAAKPETGMLERFASDPYAHLLKGAESVLHTPIPYWPAKAAAAVTGQEFVPPSQAIGQYAETLGGGSPITRAGLDAARIGTGFLEFMATPTGVAAATAEVASGGAATPYVLGAFGADVATKAAEMRMQTSAYPSPENIGAELENLSFAALLGTGVAKLGKGRTTAAKPPERISAPPAEAIVHKAVEIPVVDPARVRVEDTLTAIRSRGAGKMSAISDAELTVLRQGESHVRDLTGSAGDATVAALQREHQRRLDTKAAAASEKPAPPEKAIDITDEIPDRAEPLEAAPEVRAWFEKVPAPIRNRALPIYWKMRERFVDDPAVSELQVAKAATRYAMQEGSKVAAPSPRTIEDRAVQKDVPATARAWKKLYQTLRTPESRRTPLRELFEADAFEKPGSRKAALERELTGVDNLRVPPVATRPLGDLIEAAKAEQAKVQALIEGRPTPEAPVQPRERIDLSTRQGIDRALYRLQKAKTEGEITQRVQELKTVTRKYLSGKGPEARQELANELRAQGEKLQNLAASNEAAKSIQPLEAAAIREDISAQHKEVKEYTTSAGETRAVTIRVMDKPLPVRTALHILLGDKLKTAEGLSESRKQVAGQPEMIAELDAYAERLKTAIEEKTADLYDQAKATGQSPTESAPELVEALAELVDMYEAASGQRFQFAGRGAPVKLESGHVLAPGAVPEMTAELGKTLIKETPTVAKPGTVVARDSRIAELARKPSKTKAEWEEYKQLKKEVGTKRVLLTAPEGRETAKIKKPSVERLDERKQELERAASAHFKLADALQGKPATVTITKYDAAGKILETRQEPAKTQPSPPPEAPATKLNSLAMRKHGKLWSELTQAQQLELEANQLLGRAAKAERIAAGPKPVEQPKPGDLKPLTQEALEQGIITPDQDKTLLNLEMPLKGEEVRVLQQASRMVARGRGLKSQIDAYIRGLKAYTRAYARDEANAFEQALKAVKNDPEAGSLFPERKMTPRELEFLKESAERLGGIFRSKARKAIWQKMPNAASFEQIQGILKDVPKAEVSILRLDEKFAGRTSINKQELLDYMKEAIPRDVEVKEFKNKGLSNEKEVRWRVANDEVARMHEELKAELRQQLSVGDTEAEQILRLGSSRDPRMADWNLENLLPEGAYVDKLDVIRRLSPRVQEYVNRSEALGELEASRDMSVSTRFETYTLPGGSNYRERVFKEPTTESLKTQEVLLHNPEFPPTELFKETPAGGIQYRSSHFDTPGYLWHDRIKDRVTVDGKEVLFVEEIQSDRARELDEQQRYNRLGPNDPAPVDMEMEARVGVPKHGGLDFPFSQNWHEMAIKRILLDAVKEGKDGIAWTTGRQQADRYSLLQQVDELRYNQPSGLLVGYKNGVGEVSQRAVAPGELADWIGSDVAKKLLSAPEVSGIRSIKGQDLTVGGEHHLRLYDEMLPQFLKEFGKKWGVQPGETTVLTGEGAGGQHFAKTHFFPLTDAVKRDILTDGMWLFGKGHPEPGLPIMAAFGFLNPSKWKETFPGVAKTLGRLSAAQKAQKDPGIFIEDTPGDIGRIARLFGSVSQMEYRGAFKKLPSAVKQPFLSAVNLLALTSDNILRDTLQIKRIVRKSHASITPKEWNDVIVELMDNPDVTPLERPTNFNDMVPDASRRDPLWNEYVLHRTLADRERIQLRDALRWDMHTKLVNGRDLSATKLAEIDGKVLEKLPDNWGITEGYYRHAFPGDWAIEKQVGTEWQPIETGWRAESRFEALEKGQAFREANPGTNVHIFQDSIRMGFGNNLPRKQLLEMLKNLPDMTREEIGEGLSRAAFTPRRTSTKVGGAVMPRLSNLPGWARSKEAYMTSKLETQRYIHLLQARGQLLLERNKLAEAMRRGDPPAFKPGELGAGTGARLIAKLDDSIQALEGYPSKFQRLIGDTVRSRKWPVDAGKLQVALMKFEAVAKLGLNPMSAMLNTMQFVTHALPVLGPKYALIGAKGRWSKYQKLFNELGIHAQSTKMELEGLPEYLDIVSGELRQAPVKTLAKSAYDMTLLPFQFAEQSIRQATAIGAYEKATDAGMPPRDALQYARQVMRRTMFGYERWDKPTVLGELLPPIVGQFRTFTFKTAEMMIGLRGKELAYGLGALLGIYGLSGFPGAQLLDSIVEDKTGVSFLREARVKLPVLAKGVGELVGIDISRSGGMGEVLSPVQKAEDMFGPAGSDLIRAARWVMSQKNTRSRRLAMQEFIAGVSPHIRRYMQVQGHNLVDTRSGQLIMEGLTEEERLLLGAGVAPSRVAEARDIHSLAQQMTQSRADKKGGYAAQIADAFEMQDKTTDSGERARLDAVISRLINEASAEELTDRGFEDMVKNELLRRKVVRGLRDIQKLPEVLRPIFLELYEAKEPD